MRLLYLDKNQLKFVDEVIIGGRTVMMKFSKDGKLFAFYIPDKMSIKVVQIPDNKIENIIDILRKAMNGQTKFHMEYSGYRC